MKNIEGRRWNNGTIIFKNDYLVYFILDSTEAIPYFNLEFWISVLMYAIIDIYMKIYKAWKLTRLIIMYQHKIQWIMPFGYILHYSFYYYDIYMIQYKILRITLEWLHKKGVCDPMTIFKKCSYIYIYIIYIINILQFHCGSSSFTVRVDNIFYESMEIEYNRTPLIQIYWFWSVAFASEIWTSEFRNTSLHLNPDEG